MCKTYKSKEKKFCTASYLELLMNECIVSLEDLVCKKKGLFDLILIYVWVSKGGIGYL